MKQTNLPQLASSHSQEPVASNSAMSGVTIESNKKSYSELSARTPTYRGVNPWEGRKLGCWDIFKIMFFVLSGIFLVRLIIFLLFIFICWIFSWLTIIGLSDDELRKPFSCWRRMFRFCMRLCMRIWLFCFGFYWINVNRVKRSQKDNKLSDLAKKHSAQVASSSNVANDNNNGDRSPSSKGDDNGNNGINGNNKYLKSHCFVSDHHTAFDGFILYYVYGAATVMKQQIRDVKFTGVIALAAQNIFVDRIMRSGRKKALSDIATHMQDYKLPPLLIFPQATCSNISTITTFKVGAFIPGLPVTPIALNYHSNKFTDLSFVGKSAIWEMFYAMCQFVNFVTVEECNDYFPNSNEKKDARLFAENVRKEIIAKFESKDINVEATQHSLDDFLLIRKLDKHRDLNGKVFLPTAHIVIDDVTRTLQLKSKTVSYLADCFSKHDLNGDGVIDYNEFCQAFDRPMDATNMKKLFRLFNTKKRNLNSIEFEEFLAGISICFVNDYIDDALRAMFDACNFSNESLNEDEKVDDIDNEYITLEWMKEVINRNSENEKDSGKQEFLKSKLSAMLKDLFENENEKLSFETFSDRMMPHYFETCQLFLQTVICDTLGVKLNPTDFVEPSKVNSAFADMMRGSSIRQMR